MAPQFLPVVNQAPTVGANQNAYLNAARGYIPDPATAAGLGLPQQYTTYQASDGDPEVMRQAYAEQEARLGPMRLPSETSDDGLGLTPTTRAMPVSSGGDSDFNWLTAIGAGLQSAGAAHFGNFNVPQQYLQLKQQADQRKQEFAKQQAALEEQKKQHAFQQVTTVLANKDMSESQKASLLEGFAKGENPMIANFARTAMDGIGKKRMGRIGLYMERYPSQVQKIVEGMQNGQMSADDIDARLSLMDEVEKHNAKLTGEMDLENEIRNNPKASAGQQAWLKEREDKRKKEAAEANVKNQTQKAEIDNANLKPALTQAHIDEAGRDKSTINKLAEDLQGKPWKDLTQAEKHQVMAYEQSREIEKQEAGARAREQVKVETNLAPGVMMLDTLSKLTEKPGMFLSEKDGTWDRLLQMGTSRYESAKGTDEYRLWNQMADGMRATLARMAMEVGNLASAEQDRALHLIADPYGGLHGLPDSIEVARKKHVLLGEFLKAGLEGPQGPDGQSRVQERLKGILDKLDKAAPLPELKGTMSPEEDKLIKEMLAQGKSRRSIQAAILKQRGGQ